MVRVVVVLNPPEGMEGRDVGVIAKQGVVPPAPQLVGFPAVIDTVGVSLPEPVLLMQM